MARKIEEIEIDEIGVADWRRLAIEHFRARDLVWDMYMAEQDRSKRLLDELDRALSLVHELRRELKEARRG